MDSYISPVICYIIILLMQIHYTNSIKVDILRKFFDDEEKHDLKDMYKCLRDVIEFSFDEYQESIFTILGMELDFNKWDVMINGFCEFNSLTEETVNHLKTLKFNEFQIKDVNQFEMKQDGYSLFLRMVIEKSPSNKLNYIFSGTKVSFRLGNRTRDASRETSSMSLVEKNSLQHYFIRRALENLKRKETTFIIHATK
ncbi:hypothetical protein LOD99_7553 [Oopsacas minuta]|uniref:Uncharacterized protein n=1 Tax=Oopsacas minuta TaxID=111878 RepID=A0AAV7JNT1_9METZ|nr:hypothetical protein LOD99_7553 [Oopsacas minuta]